MSRKVLIYFTPETLTNSYMLYEEDSGSALVIDPRVFDLPLFDLLETNKLTIGAVLLTHADEKAAHAIRTMQSVYDFAIYGGSDSIENLPMRNIKPVNQFEAAGFEIDSIFLPGHYMDSLVYRVGDYLFPGDIMSAGSFVSADSNYGQALLLQCFKETIMEMPEHTMILPAFGPPSTIRIELETNSQLMRLPILST
jgi:glyoxylase-like metal-dependent hydrolase (beta-lactamase superfamily II)